MPDVASVALLIQLAAATSRRPHTNIARPLSHSTPKFRGNSEMLPRTDSCLRRMGTDSAFGITLPSLLR